MQQVQFEVLPGLPATGPWPEQFSATGQGMHREGYVVPFSSGECDEWVGNFQPSLSRFSTVLHHPDGENVIVVAGGQAYVVDPRERKVIEMFGGHIEHVYEARAYGLTIFENGLWFVALDAEEIRWKTRRLSWDGMRNVKLSDNKITGEGWMYDESWHAFEVDLSTGDATGGAYDAPES